MNQNRVIAIAVAAVLAVALLGYGAYRIFGQRGEAPTGAIVTTADKTAFEKELAVPGPLGEMTLGDKSAPVTVYEYASMTCTHCAEFAKDTFPEVKKNFVDTGKVYYVFREFPFDPVATAAFMLARCAGPERYFGFIEVLFRSQEQWAFVETPMEALKKLARQGGFSDEKFDACMKDQAVFDHVKTVAQRAAQQFGVRSTPTFFVNGEKVEGAIPYKDFEEILNKKLSGEKGEEAPAPSSGPATPAPGQ